LFTNFLDFFQDLLKQSGVYPCPTSDYSSGNESVDLNGDANNNNHFNDEVRKQHPKFGKRLVHQRSFHPADLLVNTVASLDYDSEAYPIFHMCEPDSSKKPATRIYKLVLTGGPCGGKTTGQDRLATFFENAGW
jgi:hypothetical protein